MVFAVIRPLWPRFLPLQLTLAGGLRVPKKRFQEARRDTGMEYVQNLAVLLFTRDELAGSSRTGKKGRGDGPQKPKLDADRVQAIKGV